MNRPASGPRHEAPDEEPPARAEPVLGSRRELRGEPAGAARSNGFEPLPRRRDVRQAPGDSSGTDPAGTGGELDPVAFDPYDGPAPAARWAAWTLDERDDATSGRVGGAVPGSRRRDSRQARDGAPGAQPVGPGRTVEPLPFDPYGPDPTPDPAPDRPGGRGRATPSDWQLPALPFDPYGEDPVDRFSRRDVVRPRPAAPRQPDVLPGRFDVPTPVPGLQGRESTFDPFGVGQPVPGLQGREPEFDPFGAGRPAQGRDAPQAPYAPFETDRRPPPATGWQVPPAPYGGPAPVPTSTAVPREAPSAHHGAPSQSPPPTPWPGPESRRESWQPSPGPDRQNPIGQPPGGTDVPTSRRALRDAQAAPGAGPATIAELLAGGPFPASRPGLRDAPSQPGADPIGALLSAGAVPAARQVTRPGISGLPDRDPMGGLLGTAPDPMSRRQLRDGAPRPTSRDPGALLTRPPVSRSRREARGIPVLRPRRGALSTAVGGTAEVAVVLVMALVLSVLIKTFLTQAFYIPSGSMQNTLELGDRVLVSKLTPGVFSLHRGDVIVFKDPGGWLADATTPSASPATGLIVASLTFVGLLPQDSGEHLIKRIIGLPGDTVACCDRSGRVTVNGVAIDEPYLFAGNVPSETPFKDTVPAGKLWVMGDHRAVSEDSRYHPGNNFVPIADVVGKAVLVVWPLSHLNILRNPGETFARVPDPVPSGGP